MHSLSEVAVIGGGVIGCSVAYHLAQQGVAVTLLEQRGIASAASGASAGGVRQQGRDPRELSFAIRSIAKWRTLEDELAADVHFYREGHVQVIERAADLPEVDRRVAAQRELGLDIRVVHAADLKELVPGIATHVVAGTYTADDGHANPILTTHAFANAARRHGAHIRVGSRVTRIHRRGGYVRGLSTTSGDVACDWLVLAAGAWSTMLAQQFDVSLPIELMGPQMIATTPVPPVLGQVVGALSRRLSLKQLRGGNFIIGGGWPGDVDMASGIATPRLESILGSLVDSSAIYPALRHVQVERAWVGVEALTVDEVPILGPLPGVENVTVATGFSGHGFALSPIIGQVMAELIVDGAPSIPIDELTFERFARATGAGVKPTMRPG
ncbi:MAG: NAD(P)/FAD-dependent oxidoreductase [Thermomicrobiales bacterium]